MIKNQKYKLIACDFDGTLLTDDVKISNYTKRTLLNFKDKGYIIVGVTARNLECAKSVIPNSIFDYLILNNGTYIYDVTKERGKDIKVISFNDIIEIVKLMEKYSKQIELFSGPSYYVYKKKKKNIPYNTIDIKQVDDINEPISKLDIFIKRQEDINYCFNLLKNKFPHLNIFIMYDTFYNEQWLVINPLEINKSITLESLGKTLEISLNQMIFFGDGLNDIETIKKVGCGVAMKNALQEVKNVSKYTTEFNNNEDGVALFLEKNL